ncbi:MAG: FtsK/SpoIIIE domain-containing protein [Ilumatobacteraceae bacterium]
MPSSDLPDLCVVLHRPGQRPVRRVVAGIGRHDSVASLLGLIDIPARRTGTIPANGAVLVDGRSVDGSGSIEAAGIRQGSSIRVGSSSRRPARATSPWLIVAGPDTGRLLPGDPGRYVVGTAPAAGWRIRDAAIAPHHAIVDVGESGLRSESLRIGAPLDGQRGLGTARHREQHGRSVAGVRTRTPTRPDPGRWTARLVRRPVTAATPESAIEVPDLAPLAPSGSSATGVTSSLSMLVTGLVIAAVLRRPEILLFSLAGGVIAAGAAAVAAVRRRRAARRHRARTAQATARFDRAVDAAAEAAARRLRRAPRFAVGPDGTVVLDDPWALRRWHPTAWAVVVGRGDLVWAPPLTGPPENAARLRERATRTLSAVDLRIELAPGSVVHVSGPDGSVRATVRSLVVQLLIGLGPADLAVAVVTERPDRWQWLDWPERRVAPDRAMVASPDDFEPSHVAPTDEHDERVLLLVLDDASELGTRTSAARRLLDSERPVVVIACAAPDHAAPAVTTVSVRIGEHGRAEVLDHLGRSNPTGAERPPTGIERSDLPLHVTAAGVGEDVAEAVAARLAGWSDPEHLVPGADVPTAVSLAELCGLTSCTPGEELADELVRRWNRLGGDPRPVVALGRAADGLIELDLDRDGPHMLVAGTTGAGKSELLRSLVAGLSLASPPELTSFVLVDYKGGSAFDVCAELPHVVGVVTDLDDRLAARMLVGLDAELRRRERMLRTSGATDLRHHRNLTGSEAIARLVVVIDEFAALASELPEFLGALVGVAQRGRSLGVHLVLATQRPSGVVDEDIRANTNLRLALRVQDAADSLDVLGDRRAVSLPRSIPGRAVVRFGAEELVEFQTARCTGGWLRSQGTGPRLVDATATATASATATADASGAGARPAAPPADQECGRTELEVLVEAVRSAALRRGDPPPHRPWCAPLPECFEPADPTALGLIDLVAAQRQEPLRWSPSAGHLLVAARRGGGSSTALASVVGRTARYSGPDALHVLVLDAAPGLERSALDDLAGLPRRRFPARDRTGCPRTLADVSRTVPRRAVTDHDVGGHRRGGLLRRRPGHRRTGCRSRALRTIAGRRPGVRPLDPDVLPTSRRRSRPRG